MLIVRKVKMRFKKDFPSDIILLYYFLDFNSKLNIIKANSDCYL